MFSFKTFHFYFTVYIQYYFVLVSGVQRSGQSHPSQSVPPDILSAHLAPYVVFCNIIDCNSCAVRHSPMTFCDYYQFVFLNPFTSFSPSPK